MVTVPALILASCRGELRTACVHQPQHTRTGRGGLIVDLRLWSA